MPIQVDDQQLEVLRAVWKAFIEQASEPYNQINEFLGVPFEERHPDGPDTYDESRDPVVQRVKEFARLLGEPEPDVEEEPDE